MKICKNPLYKKEFDYGTDKRVFCSPKCKNKYGYLTKPEERKVAYQQYYDQVKNPKWVKEIVCACGCGRTFEKSNRGCGQAHRKYFDKTCRGKTERTVKKDVEVKKPTSRPGSGIAGLPKVSEARMREAKRMDEIVIQAWMHAPAHERRYIEANPLNKHLSFQEAA